MTTPIASPLRATMLILCLTLAYAVDATADGCGADTPCRYALSSVDDGLTPDPWQRFHDDLGAGFTNDTDERVARKSSPGSKAADAEVRSTRAAPSRERSGLLLFWLLQKGNRAGQR